MNRTDYEDKFLRKMREAMGQSGKSRHMTPDEPMKHPDDVVKELAEIAAGYGYGLVSATLQNTNSLTGSAPARYTYSADAHEPPEVQEWRDAVKAINRLSRI